MASVTEPETEASPAAESGPATFAPHLISAERYERMIKAGILGASNRGFLWRGGLVRKMTKLPPHHFAPRKLDQILGRQIGDGGHLRQEMPVASAP